MLGSGSTIGGSAISSSIKPYNNGWYRCMLTGVLDNFSPYGAFAVYLSKGGYGSQGNYPGSIGAGFYVWGAQVEVNSVATPLIQTNGSAVTVADPKGLLIEESRTNYIRNGNALGAVPTDGVELITNGGFTLNPVASVAGTLANGWYWNRSAGTIASVVYSSISNSISIAGDGTNSAYFYTTFSTSIGVMYNLSVDILNNTSTIFIGTSLYGSSIFSFIPGLGNNRVVQFTPTSSTTWLTFNNSSTLSSTIDNVSVNFTGICPTFWSAGSSGTYNIAYQVVGSGVESNIPYVDIRWYGASTSDIYPALIFESTTTIVPTSLSALQSNSANVRMIA